MQNFIVYFTTKYNQMFGKIPINESITIDFKSNLLPIYYVPVTRILFSDYFGQFILSQQYLKAGRLNFC